MLGKTYDSQVCSAARALELVGERWSLLIVRNALFAGATRYNDFRKSLGIATNILKTRLDGLVGAGIMERRAYSQNPDLYEYLLTDKGRELVPVILALTEGGDRWVAPDGPPILYRHTACGGDISLHTVCAERFEERDVGLVTAHQVPGSLDDPLQKTRHPFARIVALEVGRHQRWVWIKPHAQQGCVGAHHAAQAFEERRRTTQRGARYHSGSPGTKLIGEVHLV